MKRLLLFGFLMLASVRLTFGATNSFVNSGTIQSPPGAFPVIDALNVTNLGLFQVDTAVQISQLTETLGYTPFDFSEMTNFVNRGIMSCNGGFIFSAMPAGSGTNVRSASFFNAGSAQILANGISFFAGTNLLNLTIFSNLVIFGNVFEIGPSVTISATNITDNGLIDVSENGLLSIDGSSVDLSHSTNNIDGLQLSGSRLGGVFEDFWGIGLQTNQVSQSAVTLPNPSISFISTNTAFTGIGQSVSPISPVAAANLIQVNASNLTTQVVIVGNPNTNITVDIRFEPSGGFATPLIRLQSILTNSFGIAVTNSLFISDSFGARTNFQLVTNTISFSGNNLLSPDNINILPGNLAGIFGFGNFTNFPVGNTPFQPTLIPQVSITNQFTALGVELDPSTFIPDPNVFGQNLTNIPGRIVINADSYLNLTSTKINGPNVLRIKSTNHFAGSAGARIAAPNLDLNLGSTNGQLNITNLIAPFIPEFVGTMTVYSARWTNVSTAGFTNAYHVLMVDSRLASTALPLIQNLQLRSTNVTISDQINIASNLLINATSLTITSNANNQFTPYGQLNLQTANLIWTANLPTLQNVTNFGLISVPNTVFFAEIGQLPYFSTNFTSNYLAFVNHGSLITSGNTTWATYYENTGVPTNATGIPYIVTNQNGLPAPTNSALVYSTFGPISIIATNALLAQGSFITGLGDISFTANNLLVSNHAILAAGALNFSVSSNLTDGGLSSNFWSVTDGINLLIKPATGDLLGTTITNFGPPGETTNIWAGLDRGISPSGFRNNAAIGHMIFDGLDVESTYAIVGPDPTNAYAIYIDQIELRDNATNTITVSNSPFFAAFDIATNVTVYFADAMLGQFDISEKLNGANGGRLVWVPSYAGFFSSTNLVYPAGVTNTFNRALVISTDIDSNGNGSANAFDTTPIFTSSMVNLKGTFTNVAGVKTARFTWTALANATNTLYFQTNLLSTNLVKVTNFVQPFPTGPASATDTINTTNKTGFYKVLIQSIQP